MFVQPCSAEPSSVAHADVSSFWERGFSGPFTLFSRDEVEAVARPLRRFCDRYAVAIQTHEKYRGVEQTRFPSRPHVVQNPHRLDPLVWSLLFERRLLEPVIDILGPELVVWRTVFWVKPPGACLLPWHTDEEHWHSGDEPSISAWLAIDDATRESGCVELAEGSHTSPVAMDALADEAFWERFSNSPNLLPLPSMSPDRIVPMELEAGQFFLFDHRTLHGSGPNLTNQRRAGLAIRFIPTRREVKCDRSCVVVSGRSLPPHCTPLAGPASAFGLPRLRHRTGALLANRAPDLAMRWWKIRKSLVRR